MSKTSVLVLSILVGSLTAFAFAHPSETSPVGGKLGQSMEAMQANVQRVSKAIDKKDAAAALGAVLEMQQAAQTAKVETPHRAADLKGDEKDKFVVGFRTDMIAMQHGLLDLEAALVAGKFDDAKKVLDEKLKPAKKAGHDKYKGD